MKYTLLNISIFNVNYTNYLYTMIHTSFFNDVTANIIAGVMVAIITIIFSIIRKSIAIEKNKKIDINGYWISSFEYSDYKIYEFLTISTNKKNTTIKIKYQSYRVSNDHYIKIIGEGQGIYKSRYIFCPYAQNDINSNQVGVYTLREYTLDTSIVLAGKYIQTHGEKDSDGFVNGYLAFSKLEILSLGGFFLKIKWKFNFYFNIYLFKNKDMLLKFVELDKCKKTIDESKRAVLEFKNLANE